MRIEFDPTKRQDTLDRRGLDMADAARVFDVDHLTVEDERFDYGETRHITVGFLADRMVVLVWTMRGETLRVISLRKANEREQETYGPRFRG